MKRYFFIVFSLFLGTNKCFSQKLKTFKGHCGLYYQSMIDLRQQQAKEIEFYDFQAGQHIASIGAQCCNWEAAYASTTDSVQFYLEDIDSTYLNDRQAAFAWNYYGDIRNKPMTCTYQLILGTEKETHLPGKLFDKILIINSFHEFNYQKKMLEDIASKLKPGGILYIDETLARKSGELHRECHKRIYLNQELISILKENGYEYVNGLELNYRNSKPVRKVFAFKVNAN
ncbi:MAG TPA: methyltransferase domain-containing protein [Chitinophagaceae bacterium]